MNENQVGPSFMAIISAPMGTTCCATTWCTCNACGGGGPAASRIGPLTARRTA